MIVLNAKISVFTEYILAVVSSYTVPKNLLLIEKQVCIKIKKIIEI